MRLLVLLLFLGTLFASENEILICENGTELLEWNHAFLEAAEESIEFSACFFGGKVCQDLLHAMERKLESIDHFQVHILTTPVLFSPDDYVLVDRLLKRYPDRFHLVHAYNVLTMESVGSIDNHMKLFVVDGKYYSMGGSNYSEIAITEGTNGIEKYKRIDSVIVDLPLGSRDQDLVGRGEAAKELRLIFFKMYAIWERFNAENRLWQLDPERYTTRFFEVSADPIVPSFEEAKTISLEQGQFQLFMGGPHQSPNVITKKYESLLAGAKSNVWIANLYFHPASCIMKKLKGLTIPITLLTNGARDNAPGCNHLFCWAHRVNYVPLLYGRSYRFWEKRLCERSRIHPVEIFEYDVKNVILHKKAMVVDDKIAVIGSYNLGTKSDKCDYELIAVIYSEEAAAEVKRVMKRDKQFSVPISPKKARSWYFDLHTSIIGETQKDFNGFV